MSCTCDRRHIEVGGYDPHCPTHDPKEQTLSPERRAELRDLHVSSAKTRGVGRSIAGVWTPYCDSCKALWPCEEGRIINALLNAVDDAEWDRDIARNQVVEMKRIAETSPHFVGLNKRTHVVKVEDLRPAWDPL